VRGDVIDALARCVTWADARLASLIVRGLDDPHEFVRWTAGNALRFVESQSIEAGLRYLKETDPESVYAGFRNAFLVIERRPERADATLRRLLCDADPVARRFGAAMCLRPRLVIDAERVALAEASSDPEILALLKKATPLPFWATWKRDEQG